MKVYVNEIDKECEVLSINTLSGYVKTRQEELGEHKALCYFNEECCKLEEGYLSQGHKCSNCPRIYPSEYWKGGIFEDDTCYKCLREMA